MEHPIGADVGLFDQFDFVGAGLEAFSKRVGVDTGRRSKALRAGANATNALPDSVKGDVLAHSKLLGPGESEVIKFKAPKNPGMYQFVCTFPGHYSMMRGIMVVK